MNSWSDFDAAAPPLVTDQARIRAVRAFDALVESVMARYRARIAREEAEQAAATPAVIHTANFGPQTAVSLDVYAGALGAVAAQRTTGVDCREVPMVDLSEWMPGGRG